MAWKADCPLHTAAFYGNIEKVKQLLDAGEDINAKDYRGRTPLHMAAKAGNDVVKLLLEMGAEVTVKDVWGRMPIDNIGGYRSHKVYKLLYEAGNKERS